MALPARRRRIPDSPEPDQKPSNGLLSHVFSFVSREFESFLLNATGGPANQRAPTRRVKKSRKRRGRGSDGNTSEVEVGSRSRTQHHRKREGCTKLVSSRTKPRSKSTDFARRYCHDHLQLVGIDKNDRVLSASDPERSTSPKPQAPSVFLVPPPPKLKKQPSITMPGSLFPRSPSLVPDPTSSYQCTQTASDTTVSTQPSSPSRYEGPGEAGPSLAHVSTIPSTDRADLNRSSLDQYVSPWRTRSVASVKDAVNRFNATEGVEADFSLMLPSPHSSPTKPVSKIVDEVSPQRPTSSTSLPSTSRKGKERVQGDGDDEDEDLNFIVDRGSGHDGVYAKERELDVAREEQREHERRLSGDQSRRASDERERDKRRIKALEEEVRRLRDELSRSQIRLSPPPSLGMPPPPPPPPPPPLPLRIDTTPCTPTTMFATARASLRHAMTPVEAPINDPGLNKSVRQGQPTVNVPSEKMAAFLQEIKTAKLRKVASGTNAMGGDGIAGPSGLSKSVNVTSSALTSPAKVSAKELLRRRSLASLRVPIGSSLAAPVPLSVLATSIGPEPRLGQKRKVDALELDEANRDARLKRRIIKASFESSSEINQPTAASSSEISLLSSLSLPPGPSQTNETDVTTPSLCSDNDRDENSIEDHVPSTPPGPRTIAGAPNASEVNSHGEQIEIMDVDIQERSHPEPGTISHAVPRRTSDLFRKRPPTSPIPIVTPRRPLAPARTKRGATPRPKSRSSLESDVDDEDDEAPAPVPFISLIPVAKSKPIKLKAKPAVVGKGRPQTVLPKQNGHLSASSSSGLNAQSKRKKAHRRRQTLEEELRNAEARSSDMDECNDELGPKDREEDVFIATGTKNNRKGFLAHGGGGGAPVFMGVGYVQGADSEDDDGAAETQLALKSTNQPSFIPRPKTKT